MPFLIEFGATAKRIFGVNSLDYNTWDAAWKLILIVAGADGEVSNKERDVILDLARNTGGSDHGALDYIGIPSFQWIQDPLEYGSRIHHTNLDVYDH